MRMHCVVSAEISRCQDEDIGSTAYRSPPSSAQTSSTTWQLQLTVITNAVRTSKSNAKRRNARGDSAGTPMGAIILFPDARKITKN
ncbi:hypothetical protein EVAR_20136_1 [Eumeta japonica]|uniref:Uncharacterized protein n=1 Tax=Eumeta variegata TaxID=151549 RepID=A0A4C1V3N2_EUMVA|nr:hypothetical protein EVAR_20136_1 [Eumeta japonica]